MIKMTLFCVGVEKGHFFMHTPMQMYYAVDTAHRRCAGGEEIPRPIMDGRKGN